MPDPSPTTAVSSFVHVLVYEGAGGLTESARSWIEEASFRRLPDQFAPATELLPDLLRRRWRNGLRRKPAGRNRSVTVEVLLDPQLDPSKKFNRWAHRCWAFQPRLTSADAHGKLGYLYYYALFDTQKWNLNLNLNGMKCELLLLFYV